MLNLNDIIRSLFLELYEDEFTSEAITLDLNPTPNKLESGGYEWFAEVIDTKLNQVVATNTRWECASIVNVDLVSNMKEIDIEEATQNTLFKELNESGYTYIDVNGKTDIADLIDDIYADIKYERVYSDHLIVKESSTEYDSEIYNGYAQQYVNVITPMFMTTIKVISPKKEVYSDVYLGQITLEKI